MKGGKTIASGGFGCVFRPSLKCKLARVREPNKISKLMTSKHALSEYNEVLLLKNILNKIPNYKKYFIIDGFTICEPDKLTLSDLSDFKKCTALPKDNITSSNINYSLDKLLLVNIPDGGEPLDDFIYKHSTYKELVEINKSLIDLFTHGIIPMNKLNIYHSDIKDSNILLTHGKNKRECNARLIDWGLAVIYHPKKGEYLPTNWKNRPLQYNAPFSNIMFSEKFEKRYTEFLNNTPGKITRAKLEPVVLSNLIELTQVRPGHYKLITHIFFMFYEKDHPKEKNNIKFFEETYVLPCITNYIVKILLSYNPKEYLDNVFVKNVDIWGLLLSYYPILEIIYDNYKTSSKHDIQIFNFIKSMYLNILFKNSDKPINIPKVLKQMKQITILFHKSMSKTVRKHKHATLSNKSSKTVKSSKYNSTRKLRDIEF